MTSPVLSHQVHAIEAHTFEVEGSRKGELYIVVLARTRQYCVKSTGEPCLGFMHTGKCRHIIGAARRYYEEQEVNV